MLYIKNMHVLEYKANIIVSFTLPLPLFFNQQKKNKIKQIRNLEKTGIN